jgi:hypothetical protein
MRATFRVKKDSFTVLADILAGTPTPFGGSSSLHGYTGGAYEIGILDQKINRWQEVLDATYVIASYHTPIAWRRPSGEWIVPAAKYSVTTSQQQGKVRAALSHNGGYTEI